MAYKVTYGGQEIMSQKSYNEFLEGETVETTKPFRLMERKGSLPFFSNGTRKDLSPRIQRHGVGNLEKLGEE